MTHSRIPDACAPQLRGVAVQLVLLSATLLVLGCDRKREAPVAAAPSLSEGLTHTSLELRTTPPGASVTIDGEPQSGTTPLKLQVTTGREHEIVARLDGHLAARQRVFAAPHEPLSVDLLLSKGASIRVGSKPEGAEARVADGEPFVTPGSSAPLPPGKYQLEVSLPGHVVERREVLIEDATDQSIGVVLVPGSELSVTTVPEGAHIYVDRVDTGVVTPAVVLVGAGKPHAIEVRKDGYGTQSRRVPAKKSGERLELAFTLEKATAIELRRRLGELQSELGSIEKRIAQLRAKQSGFVVQGSAVTELKRERAIEALEARATELQVEIDSLHDELGALAETR